MGLFDTTDGIDWASLMNPMSMPEPNILQPGKTPGVLPNPGQLPGPMDSPISPEILAKNAAARGIPPPPVDLQPSAASSDVGAALTGSTVPLPRARPTSTDVGAQSRGPGAPMDITSEAQKAGETPAAAGEKKGTFLDALKGVKAPPNPELQKISTPAAPRVSTAIKGGDLQALLLALNAAPGAGGLKLPSTLGQAIGR